MGKRYLIDSNSLIEYSGKLLPASGHSFITEIIDKEFNISFINKIEVLGHFSVQQKLKDFISLAFVFTINDEIIERTIELRIRNKIKTPDAIVAATSILNNCILITRNTADFKNIPGLDLLNPWDL